MLSSAITLLFAAAVLAAPTDPAWTLPDNVSPPIWNPSLAKRIALSPAVEAAMKLGSAAIPPELLYQGDGYYEASYNDSGSISVAFTPIAALDKRVPTQDNVQMERSIAKRKASCSGGVTNELSILNRANEQLANNLDGKHHEAGHWGWVSHWNSSLRLRT
jgi:hypothetical protein